MNILVCSAGRRVKLVQYFKKELDEIGGKVIAVDCDLTAPALSFAHHFEVVPRISDPNYLPVIKQICNKYQVTAILSLIDPELSLLAGWKDEFSEIGTIAIISDKKVVDMTFDKYRTYQFLKENDFPYIPTFITYQDVCNALINKEIQFPLMVKPRMGSASIGLCKVYSLVELETALHSSKEPVIIQPFIEGNEYGVDCYIDLLTEKVTNIFLKRKIKMRAGETDKSVAIKNVKLLNLIEQFVNKMKPRGPIDIDCFETSNGFVITEVNPRFGGGYIHAHEAGQNFVKNIIRNLQGKENDVQLNNYIEGTILIKWDDCVFITEKTE